jgi:hypothetical protein
MVSIIAFEKLCSGAKTLGLVHLKDFENDFEKPWNGKLFH